MKYKFNDLTNEESTSLMSMDLLGREKSIAVFMQLIDECDEGGVIALHGSWGAGKSCFVRMLMHNLSARNCDCVYYNAWKYDHSNDPLLPLFAEFKNKFADVPTEKLEKLTRSFAKVSLEVIPTLSSALATIFSGNPLISEATKEVTKKAADMINAKIDGYLTYKYSIEGFQDAIKDCICSDRQMVFFIDELDRCSPSFAVRTLELIKHLFIIPNVVFVLSIDKIQLAHSICGYYGSEAFDAVDYLRRFIDIEYNLPTGDLKNLLKKYFEDFGFEELCKNKDTNYSCTDLLDFIYVVCIIRKLSIRQIEKWLIALGHALEKTKHLRIDSPTVAMLTYFRTFDYGFYVQYFNFEVSDQDVIDYIQNKFHSQFFDIGYPAGRFTAHDVVAQIIWLRYGDETLRGFTQDVIEDNRLKLHLKEIDENQFTICLTSFSDLRKMSSLSFVLDAIEMKK